MYAQPAYVNLQIQTQRSRSQVGHDDPLYDITQVNAKQKKILAALGLEQLLDRKIVWLNGHLSKKRRRRATRK